MAIARHVSPFNDASPSAQAPPQALTKRDVRRNRIVEKLQNMIHTFSSNGHHHYRAQLQAIQVDMTLLVGADPYRTGGPLEDSHDEIRALVDNIVQANSNGVGGVNLPDDEAARNDFYSIAGKRYGEFVRNVNEAIEERDADLTALHNNYNNAVAELERTYQQRLRQAEEEHKALSATIRQRLTTTLGKKRNQLLRDKDQLDIADSNAMLMHPNHFSIGNNPGSPSHSGAVNNKRTRHLRHHRGASPAPISADNGDNGKRKRKFGHVEDDGPSFESSMLALAGGRSPLKDPRAQREYAQFEAPAYSIDKLFTDKELAMATDTAKIATYKYFYLPQQPLPEQTNINGTTQSSVNGEVVESAETGADENMGDGAPSPAAAAPEMERTTSHQVLTRNGARKDPLAALADLAAAAASSSSSSSGPTARPNPFAPAAPTYHAVTRSEKSGAPAPPGVSALDIEGDFEMMRRAGSDMPDDPDHDVHMDGAPGSDEASDLRRQLLDQALGRSTVQAPYRLPQLETGPGAMIGPSVEREPRTGFAPLLPIAVHIESRAKGSAATSMAAALSGRLGLNAEPMSRTTSAGGMSEIADLPAPAAAAPAATTTGRRGGKGKLV